MILKLLYSLFTKNMLFLPISLEPCMESGSIVENSILTAITSWSKSTHSQLFLSSASIQQIYFSVPPDFPSTSSAQLFHSCLSQIVSLSPRFLNFKSSILFITAIPLLGMHHLLPSPQTSTSENFPNPLKSYSKHSSSMQFTPVMPIRSGLSLFRTTFFSNNCSYSCDTHMYGLYSQTQYDIKSPLHKFYQKPSERIGFYGGLLKGHSGHLFCQTA